MIFRTCAGNRTYRYRKMLYRLMAIITNSSTAKHLSTVWLSAFLFIQAPAKAPKIPQPDIKKSIAAGKRGTVLVTRVAHKPAVWENRMT